MANAGIFYITNISHISLMTGQAKAVVLGGYGIVAPVGVFIGNTYIAANFTNSTVTKFVLPYIPAGNYDLQVINGNGKTFTLRQAITITDPLGNITPGDLGSVALPIVLPPRVSEAAQVSRVQPVMDIRRYNTPAKVFSSPTGQTTANKPLDPSVLPQQRVVVNPVQSTPIAGKILVTPFGTFLN